MSGRENPLIQILGIKYLSEAKWQTLNISEKILNCLLLKNDFAY